MPFVTDLVFPLVLASYNPGTSVQLPAPGRVTHENWSIRAVSYMLQWLWISQAVFVNSLDCFTGWCPAVQALARAAGQDPGQLHEQVITLDSSGQSPPQTAAATPREPPRGLAGIISVHVIWSTSLRGPGFTWRITVIRNCVPLWDTTSYFFIDLEYPVARNSLLPAEQNTTEIKSRH